jgi:hypothetical protein
MASFTKPVANFSEERRAHAIRWLQANSVPTNPRLAEVDKLVAVVGLLVCDDTGLVSKAALDEACSDASTLQVAANILREAAGDACEPDSA